MAVGDVLTGQARYPDHLADAERRLHRLFDLVLGPARVAVAVGQRADRGQQRSLTVGLQRAALAHERGLDPVDTVLAEELRGGRRVVGEGLPISRRRPRRRAAPRSRSSPWRSTTCGPVTPCRCSWKRAPGSVTDLHAAGLAQIDAADGVSAARTWLRSAPTARHPRRRPAGRRRVRPARHSRRPPSARRGTSPGP